ncbi:hypothetical protein V8E53_000671 [Lactarius tabidus]
MPVPALGHRCEEHYVPLRADKKPPAPQSPPGDTQWAQSGSNQPSPNATSNPPIPPGYRIPNAPKDNPLLLPLSSILLQVLPPAFLPWLDAFPNAPKDNPPSHPLSTHLEFTPASSVGVIPISAWNLLRVQVIPL